jgi:hypothetical protein
MHVHVNANACACAMIATFFPSVTDAGGNRPKAPFRAMTSKTGANEAGLGRASQAQPLATRPHRALHRPQRDRRLACPHPKSRRNDSSSVFRSDSGGAGRCARASAAPPAGEAVLFALGGERCTVLRVLAGCALGARVRDVGALDAATWASEVRTLQGCRRRTCSTHQARDPARGTGGPKKCRLESTVPRCWAGRTKCP